MVRSSVEAGAAFIGVRGGGRHDEHGEVAGEVSRGCSGAMRIASIL